MQYKRILGIQGHVSISQLFAIRNAGDETIKLNDYLMWIIRCRVL